ncbi:MAG: hypothetical protein WC777_01200 [Candidatus Gracilibacteria bacterium]
MKKYDLGSYKVYNELKEEFRKMLRDSAVHRFAIIDLSEDCSGDYIFESQNTKESFYAIKCKDSKFIYDGYENIDCYDVYESALQCERQYECYACNYTKYSYGSHVSHESYNLYYSDHCFNSNDLFGCIGLKKKTYCILNKQYSKEEYLELFPRIVEHMKQTGEWGEFHPSTLSPFAYNESVAQDFLPLSKEEVLSRGLVWKEKLDDGAAYAGPVISIPDNIKDVEPSICEAILQCDVTGKYFKIIPQELAFYKQLGLPIPRQCFEERHKGRTQFRNPRILWDRTCMHCNAPIKTTYSPERPEKVYCEACYLKTVYGWHHLLKTVRRAENLSLSPMKIKLFMQRWAYPCPPCARKNGGEEGFLTAMNETFITANAIFQGRALFLILHLMGTIVFMSTGSGGVINGMLKLMDRILISTVHFLSSLRVGARKFLNWPCPFGTRKIAVTATMLGMGKTRIGSLDRSTAKSVFTARLTTLLTAWIPWLCASVSTVTSVWTLENYTSVSTAKTATVREIGSIVMTSKLAAIALLVQACGTSSTAFLMSNSAKKSMRNENLNLNCGIQKFKRF